MDDEQRAKYVKALQAERAGYLRQGRADRVRAVEDELRKHGWTNPDTPKARKSPESRKTTADQRKASHYG